MKKWKKILLWLVCVSCILPGVKAQAKEEQDTVKEELAELMPREEDAFLFEDGDVVGFIGDSITQVEYTGISYQEFIYNYYITRYPEWDLEFRNLGTASYMASDAVRLYSKSSGITDPAIDGINKAVIMFGMNEALHEWSAELYIHGISQLVTLLNEQGLENEDIILVAPTPYDQTRSSNYTEDGEQKEDTDDLLSEYTGELKILSDSLGTHYIDLHTPMLWVTDIVQSRLPDDTLTVTDNVHPNAMGNVFAGFFFLYQQGASGELASVEITAKEQAIVQNAQVRRLKRKGDRFVSFRYRPDSLPMAVSYEFNEATQYFEVIDEISWENLEVDGLHPNTNYNIFMDRLLVGSFTGAELEEGVNLTNLDWNPGQVAAKEIEVLNQKWHTISSDYRAVVRSAVRGEVGQEAVDAAYEEWKMTSDALQGQMYEIARKCAEKEHRVEVVSEDYHILLGHELWQWMVMVPAAAAVTLGGIRYILTRRRRKKEQE